MKPNEETFNRNYNRVMSLFALYGMAVVIHKVVYTVGWKYLDWSDNRNK